MPWPKSLKLCPQCGNERPKHRKHFTYCSDACKQRAYRERHGLTPMEKTLEMQSGNATCMECGERYYRKSAKGCYCKTACRVKAHRKEKAGC